MHYISFHLINLIDLEAGRDASREVRAVPTPSPPVVNRSFNVALESLFSSEHILSRLYELVDGLRRPRLDAITPRKGIVPSCAIAPLRHDSGETWLGWSSQECMHLRDLVSD